MGILELSAVEGTVAHDLGCSKQAVHCATRCNCFLHINKAIAACLAYCIQQSRYSSRRLLHRVYATNAREKSDGGASLVLLVWQLGQKWL